MRPSVRIITTVQKWGRKVSYSLLDQAIYSGSNFFINVLLIRWLNPEEYGAYAVAFTVFLIFSGFYTAIVLEPMSVLGQSKFGNDLARYFAFLLQLHFWTTIVFSVFLFFISFLFKVTNPILSASFMGVAIFTPFLFLMWLFRQGCYVYSLPEKAFWGSILYSVSAIGGLVILKSANSINSVTIFAVNALGGILVFAFLFPERKKIFIKLHDLPLKLCRTNYFFEQWNYGRWASATAIILAISNHLYPILTAIIVSISDAGAYRAISYLFLPLQHFVAALYLLILPGLAQEASIRTDKNLLMKLVRVTLLIMFVAVIYVTLLISFGDQIVIIFYNSNNLNAYVWLLPWLGIASVITTLSYGMNLLVRVIKLPEYIFWANLGPAIFTLTIGTIMVYFLKLPGLAIVYVINSILLILIFLYLFFRKRIFELFN